MRIIIKSKNNQMDVTTDTTDSNGYSSATEVILVRTVDQFLRLKGEGDQA